MAYKVKDKIRFLSEASKILSSSLDYHVTLASIAKLVVNNLSDFCMIDIDEEGKMERVSVRVSDPSKANLAKKMFKFAADPRNKSAIYDAAKTGSPIIIEQATKKWLKTVSKIEEERQVTEKLKLNSFIFAPLKSRGKTIGVITLATSNPEHAYDQDDAALVDELSSRAGLAIDNARLFSEAQEALRTRDEFLSIASHELKTPLTSILLNLQLMLHKIQSATNEKRDIQALVKMIEVSRKQSMRMARLINDLLNISVISSGRLKIEKEQIDLAQLVRDVVARFEIQAKRTNVQVEVTGIKSLIGRWDSVRIEQVVSNLLSNAIKYGKKKPVELSVNKTSSKAILRVIDKGIGISAEDRPHVFERFQRAEAAKEFKGLGIGLYISRQIVEAHGGKLTIEHTSSKGTAFKMELPFK